MKVVKRMNLEFEEALEVMLAAIEPITEYEWTAVSDAGGRIAAKEVTAAMDQPPFPRSPLDGYALRSCDVEKAEPKNPVFLKVIDTIYAGEYKTPVIGKGEAVRIMTGAPIPPGADCVIRQEDIADGRKLADGCRDQAEPVISVPKALKAYENYCFQGEDIKAGEVLLNEKDPISCIEQGILSSVGVTKAAVFCLPRIAVLVTGDEVEKPGEPLLPGKIYDANLELIRGRLKEFNLYPFVGRILEDDPDKVAEVIRKVAQEADLIITSGGVSVGDKDIFHQVLPQLNAEVFFWKVRMKPGSPLIFSRYNHVPMIHLSGNPFAALATFELFVRPVLWKMTQNPSFRQRWATAVLGSDFPKKGGRRFLRGTFQDGQVELPEAGRHSSGMLMSAKNSNCLADLPASKNGYPAGTAVRVLLL